MMLLLLLLSHINSYKKSRVRGHTKVLEPYEDPKTIMKSKFGRETLRIPTQNTQDEGAQQVK